MRRSELEPLLVHLIAGLRRHQVREAVGLLLDYVDGVAVERRTPAALTPHYVALTTDSPEAVIDCFRDLVDQRCRADVSLSATHGTLSFRATVNADEPPDSPT